VIVTTVDARGLLCPLPLALAKRRMADVEPGATLLVLATDPEAPIDLAAWAAEEGHGFAERARAGFTEFALTKAAGSARR
jgi:tRNA 2-thiouridine synthesizing protein A